MKKTIFVLLVIGITISCSDAVPIKLTLVFDEPIDEGKYPAYFKDIVMPFEQECNDFILKPINVTRLDIGKAEVETNAWFFENTGDNTVEFSKGWLDHYFTDSLTNKYLTRKAARKSMSITSYLKDENPNVYIYSETTEVDEYMGYKVFTSAKDVNAAIQKNACTNNTKSAIVLINPKELLTITPPIQVEDNIEGLTETTRPLPSGDPCEAGTVSDGLNLKDDFLKIIDTKRSYSERDKIAKATWNKYFDDMASVKMYIKTNQKNPEGTWESGDGSLYLVDRLAYMSSITDINITRIEYHRETKKISGIVVVECHNASEIQ
jgi:hypothetical protein